MMEIFIVIGSGFGMCRNVQQECKPSLKTCAGIPVALKNHEACGRVSRSPQPLADTSGHHPQFEPQTNRQTKECPRRKQGLDIPDARLGPPVFLNMEIPC